MSLSTILTYGSVVLATLFCIVNSEGSLPSFISPCSFSDKEIDKCVFRQIEKALPEFTKGIPERGVPSTDPVKLDDIIIDGNGLKLVFSEAAMHGLGGAKLTDLKINIGKVDAAFRIEFKANLSLSAKYEADGKILILPIQGKGDANVFAQGVVVTIDSKLTQVKDASGDHFKLVTPSYKYTIEKTTFDLKNLFNGNKQLSDTTHQFANENWQQLMDDLAPPAIKQIVKTVVKAINKFFQSVIISQIVADYDTRS